MPPAPLWLHRLAHIRATLVAWPASVLDRAAIEQLFGLKRRSAIHLLAALDGYKVGKTYVVERATLLTRLDEIAGPKIERAAVQRRIQVRNHLREMKVHAKPRLIRIEPLPPAQPGGHGLPAGVTLESTPEDDGSRMVFAYHSAKELLGQVYALATAAATDYAAFEEALGLGMTSAHAMGIEPGGAKNPVGARLEEGEPG